MILFSPERALMNGPLLDEPSITSHFAFTDDMALAMASAVMSGPFRLNLLEFRSRIESKILSIVSILLFLLGIKITILNSTEETDENK